MRPFKSEKAEGCLQFYVTCNGNQLGNKARNTSNYKKFNNIYVYVFPHYPLILCQDQLSLSIYKCFFLTSLFHLNFTKCKKKSPIRWVHDRRWWWRWRRRSKWWCYTTVIWWCTLAHCICPLKCNIPMLIPSWGFDQNTLY